MGSSLLIRDLPDDVLRRLNAEAAWIGQTAEQVASDHLARSVRQNIADRRPCTDEEDAQLLAEIRSEREEMARRGVRAEDIVAMIRATRDAAYNYAVGRGPGGAGDGRPSSD